MMRLRSALLAATLLAAAGGAAWAQTTAAPGTYDVQQLPVTNGRVAAYSLTPRGDVDGVILDDGTQVLLPPHLGTQLVFAVKPGDAVTVHGLKARAIPVVQAMQVTDDASGKSVTDDGPPAAPPGPLAAPPGPPGPRQAGPALQAQGEVKAPLYGRGGEINGVLLADGTQVRLPPREAQRLAADLSPGQTVVVQGTGIDNALGRVIEARAIGPSADKMAQIALPPPPPPGGPRMGPPGGPPPPPPPPQPPAE
jgi:hypothetical protein